MSTDRSAGEGPSSASNDANANNGEEQGPTTQQRVKWKSFLGLGKGSQTSGSIDEEQKPHWGKWTLGILNDKETEEVPGTVLLLASNRNEPLGIRNQPERHSSSSLPSPYPRSRSSSRAPAPQIKRTADGQIVLDPQPDDSLNDPLNWPVWRRDTALFSLGYYCAMGGGMTALLAAAYNDVSEEYGVSTQQVALTTGLYMLGLGVGSVFMSPTAILYGKRPVYVLGATLFIISGIWCALSPNFASLLVARIFQGFAVSPVECLPSATIAEIFFLHERAYRVGIYTLLLLGGKNLMPLISAAITQGLGWRWIFWMVAIMVGFGLVLVFLFVPETFWDRTPRPRTRRSKFRHSVSDLVHGTTRGRRSQPVTPAEKHHEQPLGTPRPRKDAHVGFAEDVDDEKRGRAENRAAPASFSAPGVTQLTVPREPATEEKEQKDVGYFDLPVDSAPTSNTADGNTVSHIQQNFLDVESGPSAPVSRDTSVGAPPPTSQQVYTNNLRARTPVSYIESLKVWNGRIAHDKWIRVMVRPFILFAYPAVLWSSLVYALSIGWLIVLSEAVAEVYRDQHTYNFSALAAGLVYISPFVGGVLGTAVAGKVSDIVVRFMTRRNGGVYEPEFRLVMSIPIAITTVIGLMGFGWSVQEKDQWIVPTVFFGVLSFGCSLGSTTSITFCVDSYRQYAGEALVTLNFSKNVLHGFVFSLFFVDWLKSDGAKDVFISLGGIQLACLLTTIPMYIYGKRMRMWTVRKRMMEKF